MRTFERMRDGGLRVRLLPGEAAMLGMLLTEVRGLVADPGADNAATRRLAPRAYLDPTEEQAEAQWRELVHGELVDARVAAFDEIRRLLDAAAPARGRVELLLDAEQEDRLLRSVNDLRLALAALLEESQGGPGDPGQPAPAPAEGEQARMLLDWLTGLVADHVELLLAEMPDDPGADSRNR